MRNPSLSSSSSAARAAGAGKEAACCTKVGLKRGPWTAEEDEMLADYIRREGEGRWRTLPKKAGLLRCGKSCRLRWMNYLRPSVKRGHITPEEEDLILRLHRLLGNRWSLIAGRIPGRTDNEIKNYWNTHLSKKLMSQGIDPKTHKPLINPNRDHNDAVNIKQNHQDVIVNKHGGTVGTGIMANVNHDHVDGVKKDHTMRDVNNVEDGDIVDDLAITCCSDDAFSLFLNSLINDDMFNNNQLQRDEEQEDDQNSSCLI